VQWLLEVYVGVIFDSAINTSVRVFWQSPFASIQCRKYVRL
jgi:hypothetical protein